MANDKDLRDNTRAMNNLSDQMASFTKICTELNKNLRRLVQKDELVAETCSGFKAYQKQGEDHKFCDTCWSCVCKPGDTEMTRSKDCPCCKRSHHPDPEG